MFTPFGGAPTRAASSPTLGPELLIPVLSEPRTLMVRLFRRWYCYTCSAVSCVITQPLNMTLIEMPELTLASSLQGPRVRVRVQTPQISLRTRLVNVP